MDLGDWRSRINDIDNQILNLLNQRAEAALRIGDLKRRQEAPSYVPEREAELLTRLTAAARGPLPAEAVAAVWREIVSACRVLEGPLTVAYLAPPATFTHQAALDRFGAAAHYHPSRTIAEIFDDVERGRAQFGVVPVENSTDGAVNVTLDRLVTHRAADLRRADTGDRPAAALAGRRPFRRQAGDVASPGAGPVPGVAGRHLPDVPLEETASTAAAAELAAADPRVAAIASELAGQLYGVPVLRRRIEDNRAQRHALPRARAPRQRAAAVATRRRSCSRCRTSRARCIGSWNRSPGAGLNLTKIESRPAKRMPWEFVMFVDFEGHRDTPMVADALRDAAERTVYPEDPRFVPGGVRRRA